MAKNPKNTTVKFILLSIVAVAAFWWGMPKPTEPKPGESDIATAARGTALSVMGEAPDWSELDAYQNSITRSHFEHLLSSIYTARDGWREWIAISERKAQIITREATYDLVFADADRVLPSARYWKYANELGPAPVARPLEGAHVAIDAGHLGGKWAKMEARWLVVNGNPPICEGDMTLQVAFLMKSRLESLGAKVSLVRDNAEPMTSIRPEKLMDLARETHPKDEYRAARLAERWFYRTAEIRARANKVNDEIKPDLVLALHFNAEAWGDPSNPTLIDHSHVHMLVHGGYGDDELALEDHRHSMLLKLLSRGHAEEAAIGKAMMEAFSEVTSHPPFNYSQQNKYVCNVPQADGVWARNLLANRLYACPVVYLEPYLMNSKLDYPRMLAGEYVGLREVDGKIQPSIFHEYAEAAVAGLVRHYVADR